MEYPQSKLVPVIVYIIADIKSYLKRDTAVL